MGRDPLRIARVLIGVAATIRGLVAWQILGRVLAPDMIHLPFLPWLPRPPVSAVPAIVAVWLALAVAVTVGWRLRWTGTALAVLMGATLLFDQQTYSNHLYLLVLLVAILALAPDPGPWFRAQLTIVYGCSALGKLNVIYLSGIVLAGNLAPWIPDDWKRFEVMAPMAIASVLLEVFLAIAFWSSRWRPVAWALGVAFHASVILCVAPVVRVQLAIFALQMLALYTAFGPAAWSSMRNHRVAPAEA